MTAYVCVHFLHLFSFGETVQLQVYDIPSCLVHGLKDRETVMVMTYDDPF